MDSLSLDLHGRSWPDALEELVEFCNGALAQDGDAPSVRLIVVHGYGSTGEGGVLRNRVRGFFRRFDDRVEFTPGEQINGNPGITLVTPLKRLPDRHDLLEEAILSYCERPRGLSKITGRFRRHGGPRVTQAVRTLLKDGYIRRVDKAGRTMYMAK